MDIKPFLHLTCGAIFSSFFDHISNGDGDFWNEKHMTDCSCKPEIVKRGMKSGMLVSDDVGDGSGCADGIEKDDNDDLAPEDCVVPCRKDGIRLLPDSRIHESRVVGELRNGVNQTASAADERCDAKESQRIKEESRCHVDGFVG